MVPICDLYGLPMSVLYGTASQNPCQSHMGCPYWTHIKSHMGPLLVLYYLLELLGRNYLQRFNLLKKCKVLLEKTSAQTICFSNMKMSTDR